MSEEQQSNTSLTSVKRGTAVYILVVDDDQFANTLVHFVLSKEGYEVGTIDSARGAMQMIQKREPDLLLLDVNMPFLDGFEVCRRLKSNPETRLTPVVLVTGLTGREDRVRGIKFGADGFLSKPVDQSELLAHVRSLLSLKANTDELERAELVLFALARCIEGKDPNTEGHCERLSGYSVRLGKEIGLPEEQLVALRRAGIVHDIGKVAVPEAIVLQQG